MKFKTFKIAIEDLVGGKKMNNNMNILTTNLKRTHFIFLGVFLLTFLNTANSSTILSGDVVADDSFKAYISTSHDELGLLIKTGNHWNETFSFDDVDLSDNIDYFLHVEVTGGGGNNGFLGEFKLLGAGHVFANELSIIASNLHDWSYGTSLGGTSAPSQASSAPSTWDDRASAWQATALLVTYDFSVDYFTVAVKALAVPEPSIFALMGLGLLGLYGVNRRKNKSSVIPSNPACH
jgi:hypothetical protein